MLKKKSFLGSVVTATSVFLCLFIIAEAHSENIDLICKLDDVGKVSIQIDTSNGKYTKLWPSRPPAEQEIVSIDENTIVLSTPKTSFIHNIWIDRKSGEYFHRIDENSCKGEKWCQGFYHHGLCLQSEREGKF
ncbi:hypothetical protein [Undibacterium sp. TC9W]|uniref:hypothetical protein n=1 Tax=Undibacterium sp. TC9W TaxID=3413053 RepID=UPI003BF3420C